MGEGLNGKGDNVKFIHNVEKGEGSGNGKSLYIMLKRGEGEGEVVI